MDTFIQLNKKHSKIPKQFQTDDNRFSESFVEYILKNYTKKTALIIDPFAGLGTTLKVSEKMNHTAYGFEIDYSRYQYIKKQLQHPKNIIHDSAFNLNKHPLPKFDLCLTSPPYMHKDYHRNPLRKETKGDYQQYLDDLLKIYRKIKPQMKQNSYIIIEASNLKGKYVTTLAWDITQKISKIFDFEGETVIHWKNQKAKSQKGTYGYGYDISYCLVFRKK